MLERIDVPYAISVLTKDAKISLLTDNSNFDIDSYAFIDEEVNYNLINNDQRVSVKNQTESGFNRINTEEKDIICDVLSLPVFTPTYRTDTVMESNFLFGDFISHKLLPTQIRNMQDVITDILDEPLSMATEVVATNRINQYRFSTSLISGNLQDQYLDAQALTTFSLIIDIRGLITTYQNTDTFVVDETGVMTKDGQQFQTDTFVPFTSMEYIIDFVGDSVQKTFTIQKNVAPSEQYVLDVKRITTDLALSYSLYGTFTIRKSFVFEGNTYTSNTLEFSILQDVSQSKTVQALDGKAQILDIYTSTHDRKDVYINIDESENKIIPKVYNDSLVDSVLQQTKLNGYLNLSPVLYLNMTASKMSNLTFEIRRISTGTIQQIFSIIGDQVTSNGYLAIQELSTSIIMYKHLYPDNTYHLLTRFSAPDSFGYLQLDKSATVVDGTEKMHYEYSLFGNKVNKLMIDIQGDVFLGSQSFVETLSEYDSLYYFYSPDQNIVYNFSNTNPILTKDYENLILSIQS